jgi:hypothetical protein
VRDVSASVGSIAMDAADDTGVLALGSSQFAILIPVVLPMVAFAAHRVEDRAAYRAEGEPFLHSCRTLLRCESVRHMEELSSVEVVRQLESIRTEVEMFREHISGFAQYVGLFSHGHCINVSAFSQLVGVPGRHAGLPPKFCFPAQL